MAAPASAAVSTATSRKLCCMATRKMVAAAMADTPAARPSRPSMRFTVLVSPTIQNTVAGTAKYSRKIKSDVAGNLQKTNADIEIIVNKREENGNYIQLFSLLFMLKKL